MNKRPNYKGLLIAAIIFALIIILLFVLRLGPHLYQQAR